MVSIYDVLKASNGIHVEDSFAELWGRKLRGGYEIKTLTGVPPFTFIADGEPLIDWSIKGQTVQASTPTPSLPVDVSGVGERTGNLFDRLGTYSAGAFNNVYLISGLDTSLSYTCSTSLARITGAQAACIYFSQSTSISSATNGVWSGEEKTFTPNENGELYVHVRNTAASGAPAVADDVISGNITIMLNTGSTAQPFEPPGYKIPITCGGQTTNINLSLSTSIRRVKKLVLTGNEADWTLYQSSSIGQYGVYQFYINKNIISGVINSSCQCNITPYGITAQNRGNYLYGAYPVNSGRSIALQMKGSEADFPTVDSFKTFLQQQYANGTPVTIWYVLATPETAAVNEPLMKIGDYADELTKTGTGVDIPTVSGSNTLTVDTTVQPSSMSITFMGK